MDLCATAIAAGFSRCASRFAADFASGDRCIGTGVPRDREFNCGTSGIRLGAQTIVTLRPCTSKLATLGSNSCRRAASCDFVTAFPRDEKHTKTRTHQTLNRSKDDANSLKCEDGRCSRERI